MEYEDLAERLGLKLQGDNLDQLKQKVHFVLANNFKEPWLLIFDNANRRLAPSDFPQSQGSVLVTSQQDDVYNEANLIHPIQPFSSGDALQLLTRILPKENDTQEMLNLAQDLDYFPFAIDQAARYISRTSTPIAEFRRQNNTQDFLKGFEQTDSSTRYSQVLRSVWNLTFSKLESENPLAMQWLKTCAYFDPNFISRTLIEPWLREITKDVKPKYRPHNFARMDHDFWIIEEDAPEPTPVIKEQAKALDVMRSLSRYGLIRPHDNNETFTLHSLLQTVLRNNLERGGDFERVYTQTLHFLEAQMDRVDFNNPSTWEIAANIVPHLLKPIESKAMPPLLYERVRTQMVHFLEAQKRRGDVNNPSTWEMAERIVDHIFKPIENNTLMTLQDPTKYELEYFIRALKFLNNAYYTIQGDYFAALVITLAGLKFSEVLINKLNFEHDQDKIEHFFACIHDITDSSAALEFSKPIYYSPEHIDSMESYLYFSYRHAYALYKLRMPNEALPFAFKSLYYYTNLFGDKPSMKYSEILSLIGLLCIDLGDKKFAIKQIKKSLKMRKVLVGEIASSVAAEWWNLAAIHKSLGQKKQALKCVDKAIAILKAIPKEKEDIVFCELLNNCAFFMNEVDESEKAREYYLWSLKICLGSYEFYNSIPNNHTVNALIGLGRSLSKLGKIPHTVMAGMSEEHFYDTKPKAALFCFIGDYLLETNNFPAAVGIHHIFMSCYKKFYDQNQLEGDFPIFAAKIGDHWYYAGELEMALKFYQDAIYLGQKFYQENPSRFYGFLLSNKGSTLRDLQRFPEAKQTYKDAIRYLRTVHPRDYEAEIKVNNLLKEIPAEKS